MDKKKMKIKEELLDELIDKMKNAEAMGLKKPKVAKVDIESNDPELAKKIKEEMIGGMMGEEAVEAMDEDMDLMEDMGEDEGSQSEEVAEEKMEDYGYEPEEDEDDDDGDDDLERLKKLYRKIK